MTATNFNRRLNCMGCGMGCRVDYSERFNIRFCNDSRLAVWPDKNHYFKLAINELIFKEYRCYLAEGVVFIDFSLNNILYFINDEWLKFLVKTEMSLVLIADRDMLPLANYWFGRSKAIRAILIPHEGRAGFRKKAKKILYGGACDAKKMPAVTAREMTVLNMRLRGYSFTQIAERLDSRVKNVYQHAASLRRKFGGMMTLPMLKLCL